MEITEKQYQSAVASIRDLTQITFPVSKSTVVIVERAIMETWALALTCPDANLALDIKTVFIYAASRVAQDIMQLEGPAQ